MSDDIDYRDALASNLSYVIEEVTEYVEEVGSNLPLAEYADYLTAVLESCSVRLTAARAELAAR